MLAVGLLLAAPSTLLQLGLRDSTAQWFHTNDSTYQIELRGELVLDGENPYGHDYRRSGLRAVLHPETATCPSASASASGGRRHFALRRQPAAGGSMAPPPRAVRRLPPAGPALHAGRACRALAFRAPLAWRLWIGALLVCNPIAVRSAWFGQNDAPSLLLLVLAFALVTRRRFGWAAASLAAAVLLKQFALVALPFLALMLVHTGAARTELKRAALVFGAVVAAGILPSWPPIRWRSTRTRCATGRGPTASSAAGSRRSCCASACSPIARAPTRFGLIALLTWVPLSIWLLLAQRQAGELWLGAAAFSISILWLMFIRPHVQQLLPRVAANGRLRRRARRLRRAVRGASANWWARPVM